MATIPWWAVAAWVACGFVGLIFVVRAWVDDFGEMTIVQFLVWVATSVICGPLMLFVVACVKPVGFLSRPLFRKRQPPSDHI